MPAPLKVLFVASECAPFAKTGGLGDVVGALPKALRTRGIDVRVVMPLYAGMPWNELELLDGFLTVPMWCGERARARARRHAARAATSPSTSSSTTATSIARTSTGRPAEGYPDNLERFTFLSRGSLELCKALGFFPDIVHANDWQTALVPVYMNTVEWTKPLHAAASIYTIHNLAYQGVFDGGGMFITGLGREHYHPREFEHFGAMNLTKAALYHSTLLSTVSPTYAQRDPDRRLRLRARRRAGRAQRRSGRHPQRHRHRRVEPGDRSPPAGALRRKDLTGKAACKAALQQEAGLAVRPDVPLFGVVGRLTPQKGVDVLAHALRAHPELGRAARAARHGRSRRRAVLRLGRRRTTATGFGPGLGFDNGRAHRIEAGADFFLMPSRFEPCGLNQMYSLRYGTLPIVRATGGLVDTVANYDETTGEGTGFMFDDLTRSRWPTRSAGRCRPGTTAPGTSRRCAARAMAQDFSWERAARDYQNLYLRAYARRRGHSF